MTFNASGNFHAVAHDVYTLLTMQSLDFAVITDAGHIKSGTHLPFTDHQDNNYRIFHCPDSPTRARNCVIIVRDSLTVLEETRSDPSGRALAVDVVVEGGVLRLIALYQRPNLDTATREGGPSEYIEDQRGTWEGAKLRGEAERLRQLVHKWRSHRSVHASILGGDCNETMITAIDRTFANPLSLARYPSTPGTIHSMIDHDGWTDAYRHFHPITDDTVAFDATDKGHTFFSATGSSSRIDYMLMYPAPKKESKCVVDTSFTLGADTGHRPVLCTAYLSKRPRRNRPPTTETQRKLRVDHLTETELVQLAADLNATTTLFCRLSGTTLDTLSEEDGQASDTISRICTDFLALITEFTDRRTFLQQDTQRRTTRRRHPGTPLVIQRAKRVRRCLYNIRTAATRRKPESKIRAAKALSTLHYLGAQSRVGLTTTPEWDDLDGWASWLKNYPTYSKAVRNNIKNVIKRTKTDYSKNTDRLFATPQGRGKFYSSRNNGFVPKPTLASARTPQGTLSRDPDVYMPIIRNTVAKPFSVAKKAPAVLAYRPLTIEEKLTGRPKWWHKMYKRDPKIDPTKQWKSLMRATNCTEVHEALSRAQTGKSSPDAVSIDILKIATGARNDLPSDHNSPILLLLVSLVNACLRTKCCPPALNAGIIVMIPKPGAPPDDPAKMRPITLLSELYKITARILARRITLVLHDDPTIICSSQRAYLLDGSSRQSVSALLDVIEDYVERASTAEDLELIVTSYDIRKAFDSVQSFSIRASCERLNMPEPFITYLLSTMGGAVSRVRCRDGLTEPIELLSSVRQGDPLAALVFIIVMDPLHVGLQNNPNLARAEGYTMRHGLEVHSHGYSDDTATTSASWTGALQKHDWVREFFVAHHLRFNASKTYCIVGSGTLITDKANLPFTPDMRCLPGIAPCRVHDPAHNEPAPLALLDSLPKWDTSQFTNNDVLTRPPTYAFRYLGYQVRLDLGCSEVIKSIAYKINMSCSMIWRERLNIIQAGDLLREFLYPQIELGIIHARIEIPQLHKWTSQIRNAVLHRGHDRSTRSIAVAALFATLGVLPLVSHARLARATEAAITLRGGLAPSTETSISRLQSAERHTGVKVRPWDVAGYAHRLLSKGAPQAKRCRIARALSDLCALEHTMSWACTPTPPYLHTLTPGTFSTELECFLLSEPTDLDNLRTYCVHPMYSGQGITAFTDGSFYGTNCGYAVVLCKTEDARDPAFRFHSGSYVLLKGSAPLAGGNYAAEVKALLVAHHVVPLNVPLHCVSDAESALSSIWTTVISDTQRLRKGARSLTIPTQEIRAMRKAFQQPSTQEHTHSHTGSASTTALGNAIADEGAAQAARDCLPCGPELRFEEPYIFWKKTTDGNLHHIAGNLRSSLLKVSHEMLTRHWSSNTGAQSDILDNHTGAVMALLKLARKSRDSLLLTFLLKAVTKQLSTANKLLYGTGPRAPDALDCPLCGGTQNHAHPFTCTGNQKAILQNETNTCAIVREFRLWAIESPALSTSHRQSLQHLDVRNFVHSTNDPLEADDKPTWYESMLGLKVGDLARVIAPDAQMVGPEPDVKYIRKMLPEKTQTIQLDMLRGCMTVYHTWTRKVKEHMEAHDLASPRTTPCEPTPPARLRRKRKTQHATFQVAVFSRPRPSNERGAKRPRHSGPTRELPFGHVPPPYLVPEEVSL